MFSTLRLYRALRRLRIGRWEAFTIAINYKRLTRPRDE